MKKLLNKKIGGKRHREWAWAAVIIALCTAGVAVWGAGQGDTMMGDSVVNAGNAPGLVHGRAGSGQAATDMSVVGVLAAIPEARDFNAYLHSTGVANQLHSGSYTLFVPTNAAIAALSKGTISGLSASAQARLVEYHIVSGKTLDNDAVLSGTYQAMSNDTLNFNVDIQTGASYVNSSRILKQYKAQNGIIYLVSVVLIPPR